MDESGMLLRFGRPVPGHERAALALFAEAVAYLTEKREQGLITSFESFMFQTADYEEESGFTIIRGTPDKIAALARDEGWMNLVSKTVVMLTHARVNVIRAGDAVTTQFDRLGKLYAELGL